MVALALSIACHAGLLVARLVNFPQPGAPSAGAIEVAALERGESGEPGESAANERTAPAASSDEPAHSASAAETSAPGGERWLAARKRRGGTSDAGRVASPGAAPGRGLAVPTDRPGPAEPSDREHESPRDGGAAAGAAEDGNAAGGPTEGAGAAGAEPGALAAGSGPSAAGAGAGTAGGGGDLQAWCRSCPTPEYPARARRQGWQGTVDVDLHVGRDGAVEHVNVGRSSGFALLDAAAVTVARRSRFWVSGGGDGLRGQLRYRFVLEEARSDHLP